MAVSSLEINQLNYKSTKKGRYFENSISYLTCGDFGRRNDFLIAIGVEISFVALRKKDFIEAEKT
jgi:hypothetical protein